MEYRLYSTLGAGSGKRALIDLAALRDNWRAIRESISARSPNTQAIAVVKADAYGHGVPACVRALIAEGCNFFAVSCLEEAIAVRIACDEIGSRPSILILGYTSPAHAAQIAQNDLIQTLVSPEHADALSNEARAADLTLRTHVAVDTGMNRIGFCAHSTEEIAESARRIKRLCAQSSLTIEGMFTHFATADEETPHAHALMQTQLTRYSALREALEADGIAIPLHHVCNSAATASPLPILFDAVRVGILLWGAATHLRPDLSLSPVMRLQAEIVHVHTLLAGERLGYGGTYTADRDRTVAVLPIGYADGLLRAYSGATVSLQTRSGRYDVPIIGRICMDQCLIDITDTDAAVGDVATLLGDTSARLSLLAARANTIEYECLCLISSRVPRIYQND